MKYKIRAHKYAPNDWESQYIKPATVEYNVVMTGEPVRLNQRFKIEKDANDYTIKYLKQEGVEEKDMKIIINN